MPVWPTEVTQQLTRVCARTQSAVAVLAVKSGALAALGGASQAAQRWVHAGALIATVQAFGRLLAQRREKKLRPCRPNLHFRSPHLEAEFLLAKEVDSERVRAHDLLTQMLPQRITHALEANPGSLMANKYCNVTIMFVALQGFANLAATTPAKRLINFLNDVFSWFDVLRAHHNVYKIETVGDMYLAGAGLLDGDDSVTDNGCVHARRAAAMARDLIRVQMLLESVKTTNNKVHNITLTLKVGVHSGSVVTGIIGAKRLHDRAFRQ
eukprot:jgi/Chlat1/5757/Chrsp38S05538